MPDTQDTSAFANPPQVNPDPETSPQEILKSLFGSPGRSGPAPLPKEDSPTVIAAGLKTGMDPHPVDVPSQQLFNFVYGHKYMPVVKNGQPVYNSDGTPQFQPRLDETGAPITDPKTGRTVLEPSPYYVSPARKILQGILANALGLGAPAVAGHPDVMRELKRQQWNTEQTQVLQAAYKNAATNVQYMRQQQINARQQQSLQLKRDLANMKDDEFQQTYGLRKDVYNLSSQKNDQHQAAVAKQLKNQDLNREEKMLVAAYPGAMQQAQAEFLRDNSGKEMADAIADPHTVVRARELYEQMKPQAAYNAAIAKMDAAGELTDPFNPTAVFKDAKTAKSLSQEEKDAVTTHLINQQQTQTNKEAITNLQNAGKANAARISADAKGPYMEIPGENGAPNKVIRLKPDEEVPSNAVTPTQAGSFNVPTMATRTMAEKAPRVLGLVNKITGLIDANEKQLGPLKGRMTDLYQGKIGLPNQGGARLRLNFGLLETALMNMHVGQRGGEAMMDHFHNLIGGLKQDPENTRAVMEEIADYAQHVQKEGLPKGQPKAGSQGVPAKGEMYNGSKVTGVRKIK